MRSKEGSVDIGARNLRTDEVEWKDTLKKERPNLEQLLFTKMDN